MDDEMVFLRSLGAPDAYGEKIKSLLDSWSPGVICPCSRLKRKVDTRCQAYLSTKFPFMKARKRDAPSSVPRSI